MSYKNPESVLVVMYDHQYRILVLQRQDDPLFWQSVTGTMEPNESPLQTATREVLEETGIDVIANNYQIVDCEFNNQFLIRPCWKHRYAPGVSTNTEHVFTLKINSDDVITLSEHTDYQWLTISQALEKVWSDTNRFAIKKFVPAA